MNERHELLSSSVEENPIKQSEVGRRSKAFTNRFKFGLGFLKLALEERKIYTQILKLYTVKKYKLFNCRWCWVRIIKRYRHFLK